MVARVEAWSKGGRMIWVEHSLVEINASIEDVACAEPCVELLTEGIALLIVGAPAVDREESAAIHLETELAGVRDIDILRSFNHILKRWHIAPWTEWIDVRTYRMDDIVYSVLNDNGSSTRHVELDRESSSTLETVSRVCDTVVLAKDACTAHGTTNDRHVAITLVPCTKSEIVRPTLRCDGIAIAHESVVLLIGEDINGVKEIEPVGIACKVEWESGLRCKVAIAVLTF